MFDSWNPKRPRKTLDLTLTSMIDIMFVLLLFFMAATTFGKSGIELNPPKSQYAKNTPPSQLTLEIDSNGNLYFEKSLFSLSQIQHLVETKLSENSNLHITLAPDQHTQTQALLDVMDACKTAGAQQFSIASEKK